MTVYVLYGLVESPNDVARSFVAGVFKNKTDALNRLKEYFYADINNFSYKRNKNITKYLDSYKFNDQYGNYIEYNISKKEIE